MRKKALVVILALGTVALAEGCRKKAEVRPPAAPVAPKNIVFAGVQLRDQAVPGTRCLAEGH
jgi:hypothetical protein